MRISHTKNVLKTIRYQKICDKNYKNCKNYYITLWFKCKILQVYNQLVFVYLNSLSFFIIMIIKYPQNSVYVMYLIYCQVSRISKSIELFHLKIPIFMGFFFSKIPTFRRLFGSGIPIFMKFFQILNRFITKTSQGK